MAGLIHSFPPVCGDNPVVLILGSIPGVESLRVQQYYGHPRNSFWKIMGELLEEDLAPEYEKRKQQLTLHGIALWDVISACSREGSLDQNIKNPEPNDFAGLFALYPSIRVVFCNGSKSFQLFKRHVELPEGMQLFRLPSTSPAHAVAYEKKLEDWKAIKEFLSH